MQFPTRRNMKPKWETPADLPSVPAPIVFGEILFDLFPDGTEALGGAPFNLACHLNGFGLNPRMISRLGDDARGERVLRWMRDRAMDVSGIQLDSAHPTGVVQVTFRNGQPGYQIVPGAAWDFIEAVPSLGPSLMETQSGVPERRKLVCSGTLALRSPTSRSACLSLVDRCGQDSFVDLNLRNPWWELPTIKSQVQRAGYLKVSAEEAAVVLALSRVDIDWTLKEGSRTCRELDLRVLAVTFGAEGAVLSTPDETVGIQPHDCDRIVDTVGAGDAFSAMLVRGIVSGWPLREMGREAVRFASRICGIHGAIPEDPEFYHDFQ